MAVPILKIFAPFFAAFLLTLPLISAATKEDSAPPSPSVGKMLREPQVVRGGACELVLRGIAMPRSLVEFEVAKGPRYGTLGPPRRIDVATVAYPYQHSGSKAATVDRVEFKLQTGPMNSWGRLTATISVLEPKPQLGMEPGALDFGSVSIGESRPLKLRVRNVGGGVLDGEILTEAPWSIEGSKKISLAGGEEAAFSIVFSPDGPEERMGRLEVRLPGMASTGVPLSGAGVYRFQAPEMIAFEKTAGSPVLDVPITNLTKKPLRLEISAPSPILCESSLELLPAGRSVLRLGLDKRHFTEKSVAVSIADGPATRMVRVALPDPPALLEWTAPGGLVDLGEIPQRNIPRFDIELRNCGATSARVTLRNGEGGLEPDGTQARIFDLGSGESAMIQVVWRLTGEPGVYESSLVASHGGVDHPVRAKVRVAAPLANEGKMAAEAPAEPFLEPTPKPVRILDEAKKKELATRIPVGIRVRLVPQGREAQAYVSWNYHGSQPVDFQIERKIIEKSQPSMDEPFKRRIQLPGDLPKPQTIVKWIAATGTENPVRRHEDGSWEGVVPGLAPGYHDLRIATRTPKEANRTDYSAFAVRVDPLPSNPLWQWLSGVIGTFCLAYLLRRKILHFLGRESGAG